MKPTGVFIIFILSFSAAVSGQSLTVLTPNGGESWPAGQVRMITWQAQGIAGTVRIILRRAGEKVGDIASDIPAAQGSFSWTVGALAGGGTAAPASGYVVRVRTTDSLNSDDSNAGFRIFRQVAAQEQQHPDVQVGQELIRPDLRPGQNQAHDQTGISGLPDLAIVNVEYKPARHLIHFELHNIGLAEYSGYVGLRMEAADGGCWNQEHRFFIPHLPVRNYMVIDEFNNCDYFPSHCGHTFRIHLTPEGPDAKASNNVFTGILYRYEDTHLVLAPPIRLLFSHGSKTLTCDYFDFNAANTITRNDILNDYDHSSNTASIRVEVGFRNCGDSDGRGTMMLYVFRRQGNVMENIFDTFMTEPLRIESGQEALASRTLAIPVRRGEYYICIWNGNINYQCQCQVAFKFADEFFD